jgi:hypothetical protein
MNFLIILFFAYISRTITTFCAASPEFTIISALSGGHSIVFLSTGDFIVSYKGLDSNLYWRKILSNGSPGSNVINFNVGTSVLASSYPILASTTAGFLTCFSSTSNIINCVTWNNSGVNQTYYI